MNSTVQVRVLISGRVQGVSYRAHTARQAKERGITGWVRNTGDSRVEGVFQGPSDEVDALILWCRKGPPAAHVLDVKITPEPVDPALVEFEVRK